MIMLQALEWRVSGADKVDYVEAFLDVVCPKTCSKVYHSQSRNDDDDTSESSGGSAGSGNEETPTLRGLKDLANLQIQLSDFEPSFSALESSTVAFALVINAFEMKKHVMSRSDRCVFLEGRILLLASALSSCSLR